jgi:hypothetical protein
MLLLLLLVTMLQLMVWGLFRMSRLKLWLLGLGLVGKARLGIQEVRGQRWLGRQGVWVQQRQLTLQQFSSHMGSRL